jgi:hypothetical protein
MQQKKSIKNKTTTKFLETKFKENIKEINTTKQVK